MSRPLVSISVPVYNMGTTLPRCIESLINQTLTEIEIILIDDGCTDNSGILCDEYAQKDSRIKVCHKVNGGLGSARQAGLERATGIYYTVCDSDDWVEPEMYEKMYNKAISEDADIVICDYYSCYPNGTKVRCKKYTFTNQRQYLKDILSNKANAMTWNKLIRFDLFQKYSIDYDIEISQGEDALLLYKLLKHPLKIVTLPDAYYNYQRDMNSSSYTNKVKLKTVKQLEIIYEWKKQNFQEEEFEKLLLYSAINLCFASIRATDVTSDYYRKNILSRLDISKMLYFRIFSLKSTLVLFSKVAGLKSARIVYRLLYKYFYH